MKHTKGKWEASKRFDLKKNLVGISISDTEKKIGVMITYSSKQLPMDEVQANANLIASAPELLKLAKDLYNLRAVVVLRGMKDEENFRWDEIKSLIDKAEGE